jgi:hypothetical protein
MRRMLTDQKSMGGLAGFPVLSHPSFRMSLSDPRKSAESALIRVLLSALEHESFWLRLRAALGPFVVKLDQPAPMYS